MSTITLNRSINFDETKIPNFYFFSFLKASKLTFLHSHIKMQNKSDLSFQEFGNNEASDDELDLNEDYSRKTVNIHGKKIRGADLEWRLKYKFLSP